MKLQIRLAAAIFFLTAISTTAQKIIFGTFNVRYDNPGDRAIFLFWK